MPPNKTLLAQLPDPRRCKQKNPAAELDRLVRKHLWFRFGFRAGNSRISFDYAADGSGRRPDGELLVCRMVSFEADGAIPGTTGPAGEATTTKISKMIRQIRVPAPDLTTLWVSRDKRAPKPLPFADLVAAALVQLLDAKATPPEQDGALGLAQRALASDCELHAIVNFKGGRSVVLESGGAGTVSLHYRGRRPTAYISLADAIRALADRHGSKIEATRTRFERFTRDNGRMGAGPWVDTPTLRKLIVAALSEASSPARG